MIGDRVFSSSNSSISIKVEMSESNECERKNINCCILTIQTILYLRMYNFSIFN